jgi:hypothetical protein
MRTTPEEKELTIKVEIVGIKRCHNWFVLWVMLLA